MAETSLSVLGRLQRTDRQAVLQNWTVSFVGGWSSLGDSYVCWM